MLEKYNAEILKSKKFLKLMNMIDSLAKKWLIKKYMFQILV
ncbi:hypothetical protein SSYRP_v1c05310 [Spiroplasma syrphidicola EA-1]|uniref:Uncharacterized protein n=1 Tax=Spiroplasma syrphidicola EA-1 TaxID=1276229 RepID=R4ULL0_9MOLU|nr:hypothetical protein SSYRP_v1c05310 [Spiroplasma syrphidicola EA-1]